MNEDGPDSYMINYQEVKNAIRLRWKMKPACKYLPLGRKESIEMLPRRLKNSKGIIRVYVVLASEIQNSYFHDTRKKLFLIPYEIQTNFVIFSAITGKQYKLLKNK